MIATVELLCAVGVVELEMIDQERQGWVVLVVWLEVWLEAEVRFRSPRGRGSLPPLAP